MKPVRLVAALALVAVVIAVELVAGPALRPPATTRPGGDVLAVGGVAGLIAAPRVDPAELAQVAASPAAQHPPAPLALPAQALVDALLLVTVAAFGLPRLLPGRVRAGGAGPPPAVFVASLAIMLGAIAVAVIAIARLRYRVALYISPPAGTVSYLLLYGSFPRGAALVALTVLLALKVGAAAALLGAVPGAPERGLGGVMLTSVAATVVTAFCYALAPTTLVGITDVLAAAVVALAAVLWAGLIVSGAVRRLV